MTDMNILDLFLKASLLVKLIMLILIGFFYRFLGYHYSENAYP